MTAEKYILITGAGSGLGRCIALNFAQKGYSLALASLMATELENIKNDIEAKHTNITIKTLAVDMLQANAHQTIAKWIDDEKIYLHGLVNNVGFGYAGEYEKTDTVFLNNLLQLNVVFTNNLTHILAPKLLANKPAFILNVASMAAYFSLPYKTVYAASKAFVLSFSKALRQEFKEKGVNVSCITPGPMITNDEVRERIKHIGWRKYVTSIAEPDKIAAIAVKGVLANKAVILPTFSDKLNVTLKAIIPSPLLAFVLGKLSKNSF